VNREAPNNRWVCARRSYARGRVRGFTLVEAVIILLVLGILATVVIPQFSVASQQDRLNLLTDQLQYLRTQIAVFKAQHQDVPPGYPEGDPTSVPNPDVFMAQMTQYSDVSLRLSRSANAMYPYGPYLGKAAVDPLNQLSTIKMVGNNQAIPKADGTTGWIYKPQTQEFVANVVSEDGSGTDYTKY
jgi:type II secretory pathway pseudopilin PulG